MSKKLPNLYANIIDKEINNNKNIFYSTKNINPKKEKVTDKELIDDKIKELFDSPNYVYKMKTTITLKDNSIINKEVIGRKSNKLITMDAETIDINDIKEILF
jgi:hypothetical protein